MNADAIEIVRSHWQASRESIVRYFDLLWEQPELPNMEYIAAQQLGDWLQAGGFEVERAACGIPTAFIARWRNRSGPCVGILVEYDALPGTDNDRVPFRKPIGNPAGHACGHNQIGPANVGAALAARESMLSLDISGELVVLGCPAEEIVWGKIALLKLGGFDGIDAILTSHGDYQNGAISRPCQSVIGGEFVFYGESGHGGKVQKRNALDAAELAVQSIERLRAHHFADTGVEHVLRIGGHIPNVTPDEARLWISTRHEDFQQACDVYDFVKDVCDQAATMTKTTFQHQFISGTRGYLPNDTMAEVLYSNFEVVGPPKWSESDISWMQQLVQGSKSNSEMTLDRELGLYKEGVDPFGQDDGEASWRIPLARANWAIPLEVPFHNWTCTALSGHPASHAGPLAVSEALALTALDLFSNPSLVDEAKEELNRRRNNHTIDAPMLGAFETMTTDPKSFWDGSWRES